MLRKKKQEKTKVTVTNVPTDDVEIVKSYVRPYSDLTKFLRGVLALCSNRKEYDSLNAKVQLYYRSRK